MLLDLELARQRRNAHFRRRIGQRGHGHRRWSGEGDTYTANLVKPGKSGKYTFTLVSAMPGPPSLDTNVWQVKVVDGSGKAPSADQLSAYPYMPKMGHGSSQVPQIAASGTDGEFTVSDVYLFMDGLWTSTISVASPPVDGGTPKYSTARSTRSASTTDREPRPSKTGPALSPCRGAGGELRSRVASASRD